MHARKLVIRSIETRDGLRCVDIFRRPDLSFGFAEYRRDPEDPGGWYPTGLGTGARLATGEAALAEARRHVPWLEGALA